MKFRAKVHSIIADFFKEKHGAFQCAVELGWLVKEDPKRIKFVLDKLEGYLRESSQYNYKRIKEVIRRLRERSSVSTGVVVKAK